MATSSCPKCSSTSFEVREVIPRGSNFNLLFVQCASCGAVVGTMDFFNIGERLNKQDEALKRIAQQVGVFVDL